MITVYFQTITEIHLELFRLNLAQAGKKLTFEFRFFTIR